MWLSIDDWSIIMTGPDGLLLVVPTYMHAVPVAVLLVGLPKENS